MRRVRNQSHDRLHTTSSLSSATPRWLRSWQRPAIVAAVCAPAFLAGCHVTPIKPADLAVPQKLSCIHVPQVLQATELKGPFKVLWETRLAEGPYISEREDERGTFYRGPPGAYSLAGEPKKADGSNTLVQVRDGGIYVPKDGATPPSLYVYFSMENAEAVAVPAGASCASVAVARDPVTHKLSVAAFALGGGIGGAAGGAGARAIAGEGVSYGKAAGYGAAGGAIGGAIVASLINMDIGKIIPVAAPEEPRFAESLRKIARDVVPVEAPLTEGGAH